MMERIRIALGGHRVAEGAFPRGGGDLFQNGGEVVGVEIFSAGRLGMGIRHCLTPMQACVREPPREAAGHLGEM